jgi:hypothetical protein
MDSSTPSPRRATVHRLDDYRSVLPQERRAGHDEVWAEIMAAADLFATLREAGMSVHFEAGEGTSAPRVRVTDLEGRAIRDLSPTLACDPQALRDELLSPGG